MDAELLSAIGEPNRLRIIELLNSAPRPVGEIAERLGLRQPQATKHLQTLERAGLVTMHPLGQRRIYALSRETLDALRRWLDTFAAHDRSEAALQQYVTAIKAEAARAKNDPEFARGRRFVFRRELAAPPGVVWAFWSSGRLIRKWWSPTHFEVVRARVHPVAAGPIEIVMREADGSRYVSRGRYLLLSPPKHLRFELGPLGSDDHLLLSAVHDVTLSRHRNQTRLLLKIRITAAQRAAAFAVAGMELGWNQLLDKLENAIEARKAARQSPPRGARPALSTTAASATAGWRNRSSSISFG